MITGLVLLLSATAVVGTGGEWERERTNIVSMYGGSVADYVGSRECVRMVEVKQELAAVKAEVVTLTAPLLAECHCQHFQGPLLLH